MAETEVDQWAEWLMRRRHGGDPDEIRFTIERLAKVRDRVLDNAGIVESETVLDVGTGEGLIAFGALPRVGERGSVILSDISRDLLDHDRALAEALTASEVERFSEHVRPLVERGDGTFTVAVAYLWGVKGYDRERRRRWMSRRWRCRGRRAAI